MGARNGRGKNGAKTAVAGRAPPVHPPYTGLADLEEMPRGPHGDVFRPHGGKTRVHGEGRDRHRARVSEPCAGVDAGQEGAIGAESMEFRHANKADFVSTGC